LQDHVVRALDLPVCVGVRHVGPVNVNVVLVTEPKEFLLVNCVLLSVMMEFGTPNRWMMLWKKSTACSDLILVIGRTSIHFENSSMVTSRCM
jgi:hypothetical protein